MDNLKETIKGAIKDLYGVDDIAVDFADVPAEIEGDYSTNIAMRLARQAGKAPRMIAEEMWHLLHEEPDYADEILDSYEKLVRDRRIQQVIGHLPEEEGYMTENAVYVIPEWADEILNDWGDDDDQDDDD